MTEVITFKIKNSSIHNEIEELYKKSEARKKELIEQYAKTFFQNKERGFAIFADITEEIGKQGALRTVKQMLT